MSSSPDIFVTERPTMSPAKCGRCSGSTYDGRKYVDFGVDLEITPVAEVPGVIYDRTSKGVLYLCSYCIREIFKATFPDTGPPVAKWESDLADAKQIIELQKDLLEQLRAEVDVLKKGVPDDSSDSFISTSSDSDSSASVSNDETESVDEPVIESKPRITGSSSKSRHKNIPSLAELLKIDY